MILSTYTGWCQDNMPISKDTKFIQLKDDKEYALAEQYLLSKIDNDDHRAEIYFELAELMKSTRQYAASAEYYMKGLSENPNYEEDKYLFYIEALIKSGQLSFSKSLLEQMEVSSRWTNDKKIFYYQLIELLDEEQKTLEVKNNSNQVLIYNLGSAINSEMSEYYPFSYNNDIILLFTRRVGGIDEDFFYAIKDSCREAWYQAENMGYPPNSMNNEGTQFVSYDRKYLIQMKCNNVSENGRNEGGCDLYLSYKEPLGWSPPQSFDIVINTPAFEGMGVLSSDNQTLYFVSNRAGGMGGMDIWMSKFIDKKWQPAVNLGPEINGPFDEITPFIAPDNRTLYFSSNRKNGLGGQDIYKSTLGKDGRWSKPENLGAPYNTTAEEYGFSILPEGDSCYLSSNRNGGYGGMDIYKASLMDRYKPIDVTFIEGFVIDSFSHQPITNATITIKDQNGEELYKLYSNRGDGSYFVVLPAYKKYEIAIERWDYPIQVYDILIEEKQLYPSVNLNFSLIHWKKYDELLKQNLDYSEEDLYIEDTAPMHNEFYSVEYSEEDSHKQKLSDSISISDVQPIEIENLEQNKLENQLEGNVPPVEYRILEPSEFIKP